MHLHPPTTGGAARGTQRGEACRHSEGAEKCQLRSDAVGSQLHVGLGMGSGCLSFFLIGAVVGSF